MKIKKIKKVKESEFADIYTKKIKKSAEGWKRLFGKTIDQCSNFVFSNAFWYVGDFRASKIMAVGGDCEKASPLTKKEWIGLNPMEIGKLFHPLDMAKMQAYTVYIAGMLASKTPKEREGIKISMLFRMLNADKNYTWRVMQYPQLHYENNMPKYILCLISDYNHLVENPKCAMYILDNSSKENTLFYCEDENITLIPVGSHKSLSERELQVVKLLAKGLISKEIASVLKISKNTVENHKQNIFQKTATKNLAELISYAHKNIFEKN